MIGLGVVLGEAFSTAEGAVHISGAAGRVPARTFRALVRDSQTARSVVYQYALAIMQDLARTAGCNQVHSVRQRCARRLLMGRDLAGTAGYPLRGETLANLLGVQRASVSQAAEALRQTSIIEYRRGWIHIIDARALEKGPARTTSSYGRCTRASAIDLSATRCRGPAHSAKPQPVNWPAQP